MSASLRSVPSPSVPGLPDLVRGALLPAFSVEVHHPDRLDPVLWGPACLVPDCPGASVPATSERLCLTHAKRRRRAAGSLQGFLAQAEALDEDEVRRTYHFDCSAVTGQLRLEVQYGLQVRHQQRHFRLYPRNYRLAVEWLQSQGVQSVLDLPWERAHKELFGSLERGATAFVRHTRDALLRLQEPERLEDIRIWRPRHFPGVQTSVSASNAPMDWTRIAQPWLAEAGMRWLKVRLASVVWPTAHVNFSGLVELSEFLSQRRTVITGMHELDRDTLVDFLLWMRNTHGAGETNTKWISAVRLFLNDYRVNGWEPHLPATAMLRPNEAPKIPSKLPRDLKDTTMAVLTDPDSVTSLPLYLLVAVIICIRQGLRIGSVLRLPLDCLDCDDPDKPVLTYGNTKRKRETRMPIMYDDVVVAIRRQQEAVRTKFGPDGTPWLLPALYGNVDGRLHLSYDTVSSSLSTWVKGLGVQENVTWHRFRHTFAMQLLNDGLSLTAVQKLLDHSGPTAVAVYAQMRDETVRKEWEQVKRVDADGQPVDIGGRDKDLEWLRDEVARAKVALANGYCGLPIQQSCEARNACLDCKPYFITTDEFLPVHERQRAETAQLIERAKASGSERMVERNEKVLFKLDGLIASLKDPER